MHDFNKIKCEDFFGFGSNLDADYGNDFNIAGLSEVFQVYDGIRFVDIAKFDQIELCRLNELKSAAKDNPLNACDYLINSLRAFKCRNDFLGRTLESFFENDGSNANILLNRFNLVFKNHESFHDHLLTGYRLFTETARALNLEALRERIPRLASIANQ